MSMNFSEFKRRLGEDPLNMDDEMLRARQSSPEFEQAATEAEAFERSLNAALNVAAPTDLLKNISAITETPAKQRRWAPLAMAASLIMAVGAAGIVWQQTHQWESVEAYVADHYHYDGANVIEHAADQMSELDINNLMARFDASAIPELAGLIGFVKVCPTPDGKGAHMVLNTESGPVSVIFMPKTQVTDGEVLEFEQAHAYLVNLDVGSAVIIAPQGQPIEQYAAMIRSSIKTGLVDV